MTMNVGSGYPMMGNNMSMMSGMSGMGMSSGMGGSENVPQYFMAKYGCEDCFRKSPYPYECSKPFTPEPPGALKPSLFKRILNNIIGG